MTRYLEILFRHRLRFILLLLVLPAEIAVAVAVVFPHASAESSLWTDSPTYFGLSTSVTGWNQYLTPAQNTVDSLTQLTSTGAFLSTLSRKLDASGANLSSSDRSAIFYSFSSDMKITASGSHLVVLNYTCSRAPICVSVLTATVDIYRDWLSVQQQAQSKAALDFYSGQLKDAQATLEQDQIALNAYLTAHPGTKPADAVVNPQFDELISAVTNDQATVRSLQSKIDALKLTDAAAAEIDKTIFKVVDPPRATGGQLSSLPRKQLILAEAACFALAVGVLMIMAWSDRNIRDPKDLQARLRIPVVATIPDLASYGSSRG